MPLKDQQVHALLVACRETHDDEIDCDAFLSIMAPYAEARAEGRALPPALTLAEEHERLCANCREECHALMDLLRSGAVDA
jgi:hypothetical protein